MGMLTFFGSRAGRAYFVLPSDCDTLRKPSPDQVSERGQRPLRTTRTDLCTALWCECAHKTTLEMHRNGPAGAGILGKYKGG